MKRILLIAAISLVSCRPANHYNVCLQFYDRGRLIKLCGLSEYSCNNKIQMYNDRKGNFPRYPEEGCFYNTLED